MRAWALVVVVLATGVSACDRGPGPSLDALRAEARGFVGTDEHAARNAYARVRSAASRAGDCDALVEANIFFTGGDPRWIDALDVPARADAYARLRDVEGTASAATAAYNLGVSGLVGWLATGVLDMLLVGAGWDRQNAEALLGVSIGFGVAGLGTFIAGIALDVESGAQRQRWHESLRPPRVSWSIGPGSAGLAAHF